MNEVKKEEVLAKFQALVDAISKADLSSDAHSFVQKLFEIEAVAEFLI